MKNVWEDFFSCVLIFFGGLDGEKDNLRDGKFTIKMQQQKQTKITKSDRGKTKKKGRKTKKKNKERE